MKLKLNDSETTIMAFIYVITNTTNGKKYVGKTNGNVAARFREHIRQARRLDPRNLHHLHRAINEYGAEHFIVETLEECSYKHASERERYWINKLNTYHFGYNETHGGDGKNLYDYEEIAAKYIEIGSVNATAKIFSCDVHTVRKACRQCGVTILHEKEVCRRDCPSVLMLPERLLFDSTFVAAMYVISTTDYRSSFETAEKRIRKSAKGIRKTAYKHEWALIPPQENIPTDVIVMSTSEVEKIANRQQCLEDRRKLMKQTDSRNIIMDDTVIFSTVLEAADAIAKELGEKRRGTHIRNIRKACCGIRKTAYGHTWSLEQ